MTVTVRNPENIDDLFTDGIHLDDSYAKIRVGQKAEIIPRLHLLESPSSFTYKSENTKIATVDSRGEVTAVSPGDTIIQISSGDYTAKYYISVYKSIYKGIDVSRWQNDIDWAAVSNAGISFAMIRSSYGHSSSDARFYENVEGCIENNIAFGFYHYCYAKTPAEARTEAHNFLQMIASYSPDLPVVLDIEESFYGKMTKAEVMAIIDAFNGVLDSYGYETAVYSYSNFLMKNVDVNKLGEKYPIWVASWGNSEKLNAYYDGKYFCWQYSSTGKVAGIDGDVDLNYLYR
jgi:GH25 family lysozyme M1 (1,4-beta-N-acetylmuramidase)